MKHRLLIDIDVLLDVLAERHPHVTASAAVWAAVEKGAASGWMRANSITTLYYLLRKLSNHRTALIGIQSISAVFTIAVVDAEVIGQALTSPWSDFEDAVQHQCAIRANATAIVTRNVRHFRNSEIPVFTPETLVAGGQIAGFGI